MFFLIGDVLLNRRPRGSANRKRRVAFLPGKCSQPDLLMDPNRGCLFQFAQDVGQAVAGFQTDEKMDMIGYATDPLWEPSEPGKRASQVLVQPRTPLRGDDGFPVFGAEDQVVMKAEIS